MFIVVDERSINLHLKMANYFSLEIDIIDNLHYLIPRNTILIYFLLY